MAASGRVLVVTIAAAIVLIASTVAQAQQKFEIKWGGPTVASAYYWDVLAAIELGFMEAEGLSIRIINNDTPIQSLQFLATGALDISSINTETAISAIDKGADFTFVGAEDARIGVVLV